MKPQSSRSARLNSVELCVDPDLERNFWPQNRLFVKVHRALFGFAQEVTLTPLERIRDLVNGGRFPESENYLRQSQKLNCGQWRWNPFRGISGSQPTPLLPFAPTSRFIHPSNLAHQHIEDRLHRSRESGSGGALIAMRNENPPRL